jgi:WD40 repeat protein
VVRISSSGKLLATGGDDGYLRLWQFPTLKPLRDLKAHEKEVDDVDFSPDSQKVKLYNLFCSVGTNLNAFLFNCRLLVYPGMAVLLCGIVKMVTSFVSLNGRLPIMPSTFSNDAGWEIKTFKK